MSHRLLTPSVHTLPLEHTGLPAAEVIHGSPTAGATPLASLRQVEIGIWEMTLGGARDTEVDEVFIVLSGRGTVLFEDGESIALSPGTAVLLTAGERTQWQVHETLRKVYVAAE